MTDRQQSTHHTNSNNRSAATQCSFRGILLDLLPDQYTVSAVVTLCR